MRIRTKPILKIKVTDEYRDLPKLKQFTSGSVGIDLYCVCDTTIIPKQKADVPCGIKLEIPDSYYIRVVGRSSTFMLGLDVREGIIDQDFRGEIFVGVLNFGDDTIYIKRGDRLGQMLLCKKNDVNIRYVKEISKTDRDEGGFGSTDITIQSYAASFMDKEFFEEVYVRGGLSCIEIAKRYNVSKNVVLYKMKECGIDIIKSWERYPTKLSYAQRQFLIGTILGDSSVKCNKGWTHAKCSFTHGPRQIDYLRYKKEIMSNFVLMDIAADYKKDPSVFGMVSYYFMTVTHPIFTELRKLFYPNGIKIVTPEILSQVDLYALSFWYMDDGSFHTCKKSNSNWISLHIEGYDIISQNNVIEWLNNKGYLAKLRDDSKGHKFAVLNAEGTRRFVKDIESYMIPTMLYKIGIH